MSGTDWNSKSPGLGVGSPVHGDAWGRILREHQSWLWTIVRSRMPDREEAAEVFQEVACAVIQTRRSPETVEAMEPWLYRLTLRQCLLFRRKQGRRRKWLRDWQDRLIGVGEEPGAAEWVLRNESREQVQAALGRLRPGDRDIILLKLVERWSYERIAQHLGVSRHAVEYRLERARRWLRQQLSRELLSTLPK